MGGFALILTKSVNHTIMMMTNMNSIKNCRVLFFIIFIPHGVRFCAKD